MTMPELDSPEFAPIRADLARLYIVHHGHLGLAPGNDAWIIEHVDLITFTLYRAFIEARKRNDDVFLARIEWWRRACGRLFDDEPAMPLDG
jgi:hypothetical protein